MKKKCMLAVGGAAEEDGQLPAGVLRPDGAQGVL